MDELPGWGLSRVDLDDAAQRSLVALARAALDAAGVAHGELRDGSVLVGDDLLFVPCGSVGSAGALFIPSTSQLIQLGSYNDLDDFLWAHHRGLDLSGETRWERSNTLTVTAVHHRDAVLAHLGALLRPLSRREIARALDALPAEFEGLDLYFTIPQLRALEEEGLCELEITAPGRGTHPGVIRFYSVAADYGFLSNFAPYPIVLDGKRWPTSEHYFQAQKFDTAKDRDAVRAAGSPMLAARVGRDRKRKLRRDWESAKVAVMRKAVGAKFRQHESLAAMLLATGTAKLVEHTESDSYWGDGGDGSGKNMLGRILMDVRAELAEERD